MNMSTEQHSALGLHATHDSERGWSEHSWSPTETAVRDRQETALHLAVRTIAGLSFFMAVVGLLAFLG